ncbi:hypothetical protein PIB30_019585 [Stylosanthes scabra]|uniref:Uncharacterized protein n=1 Tax=Stylosanthes scabra TaxID=79078 RepID=A0ABU6Y7X0_9FABA|nr:hypothetical protein [Stylosanthes scabra]
MGSGVIYYEYEKREMVEDYNMKADAELGTFKNRRYHLDDEAFVHPLRSVRLDPDLSDTTKRELEGWNPQSRRRMLVRKIPRKRFLLHLTCLWTSMRKKDYLRYIKELKRRPELSPLRSRQASAPNLPRRQLIDSLTVITLRVMISLEFGNRHCQV